MKPTWKKCCAEEWHSGIELPPPGDAFTFNKNGICTNPHVLGAVGKGWRVGVYTARNEAGRWVYGLDLSFINAGLGYGASSNDRNHFHDEWGAQSAALRFVAAWVERNANAKLSSCPIIPKEANECLRMVSLALDMVEPRRVPIYTQLSLF